MYKDFNKLPDNSRCWIYVADREIGPGEKVRLQSALQEFCDRWQVHGVPVDASFLIVSDWFVVLAVSEEHGQVSGCSIDSSVQAIKAAGQTIAIDFFDRTHIPFQIGDNICRLPLQHLRQKYKEGIWNESTPTFNTMAQRLGDFRREWVVPAGAYWVSRYMDKDELRSVAG